MAGFADDMKQHQVDWALRGGIPRDHLEVRNGQISWVLKREHRESNMFDPTWWRFIDGHEHRWARSLNSSQCFAVNLFAPAAERPTLAQALLTATVSKILPKNVTVDVSFEHTPKDAANWLGEKDQPTQVDVFFTANTTQQTIGHLLVEVKLTEAEFGSCRGPKGLNRHGKGNPHPEKCGNGAAVVARHRELCWLASSEGRQYWDIIAQRPGQFDFTSIGENEACPFGGGLYQLLRNYSLGNALVTRTNARWAVFAICVHAKNVDVYHLKKAVAGQNNAVAAFRQLAGNDACRELDPRSVVAISEGKYPELSGWASWMRSRYLLDGTPGD